MSHPRCARVLLVDDHRDVLAAAARLLKPACDIVGEITSGRAVIDSAKKLRPDVVVLDLNLGDASGLELCPAILDAVPGVRVVILTAFTDPEIEYEAFRRGASAFVTKENMGEQLLTTIRRMWGDEMPVRSA